MMTKKNKGILLIILGLAIIAATVYLCFGRNTAAPTAEETPAPAETPLPTPVPTPSIHKEEALAAFSPAEMHDLVAATYYIDGVPYAAGDADAGDTLNRLLGNLEKSANQQPIQNAEKMFVRRGDGKEFLLELADDGSGELMADGVRYRYDEAGRTELMTLFYYNIIHQRFAAGESIDSVMEHITKINWRRYAKAYGNEETMELIKEMGEWILNGNGTEHYREIFDSTWGIENSYLEAYAYYVTEAYELHKQDFCLMALNDVSEESYYRVVDMLCSYWATSRDNLWTRFSTAARTGY